MENSSSSAAEGVREIVTAADIDIDIEDVGAMKRQLFDDVMRRNWSRVLETYRTNIIARTLRITQEEDTVLHLAVLEGGMGVVRKLVRVIKEKHPGDSAKVIIGMQNKKRDTPLHLAAELGMVEACELLASMRPSMIVEARNTEGETPLFYAARLGMKKTFYALQDKVDKSKLSKADGLPYSRRNDGNTILHITIREGYFDLALEIIYLYPNLVHLKNYMGQSALHFLAKNSYAFKSGSRIRGLNNLIYSCIVMDPFKPKYQQEKEQKETHINEQLEKNESELLQNYKICLDLLRMLGNAFHQMAACFQGLSWRNCFIVEDEEIPRKSPQRTITEGDQFAGQSNHANQSETGLTCLNFIKLAMKPLFIILGFGGIEELKRRNMLACQIMNELVQRASQWRYEDHGKEPPRNILEDAGLEFSQTEDPSRSDNSKKKEVPGDTPILIAAKVGILEMVKKILDAIPTAIQDLDSEHKNIVLLAVEFRQPHVYEYMVQRRIMKESILGQVDSNGNSALHLAALPGQNRRWVVPGAALQMQCEIKWYKYIERSMEPDFFRRYNNKGQTAWEIFTKRNEQLVENGRKWLSDTSQSCSVVAALIATVAFTSATAVPGGLKQDSGFPTLDGQPAFNVFAIAAFMASCFSVASLIVFLSLINSGYQEMEFVRDLPLKLALGLTFLFMSIAAMLVSFCAGHFYVIGETLKVHAYPIYAIIIIPILLLAMVLFPFYMDLIGATIARLPQRIYELNTD